MNTFGNRIRDLRTQKKLLLRQVAAYIESDTALLSKIERGERKASRTQVLKMAEILKIDSSELLELWLAEKILEIVKDEEVARKALKIVEQNLPKQ